MSCLRLIITLPLVLMPASMLADSLPAAPYIQVQGHGSVSVVPDMARVSFSVSDTNQDAAVARSVVERRAARVIDAARKLGIARSDIEAASISIWPEYRWQNEKQVFVGQHVSRAIEFTLRNLSQYPELVTALVKAGVANLGNATLDRSDMPDLRRQALAQAVEDAHKRALAVAAAAGVKLGAVYSITENSGVSPRPVVMAASLQSGKSSSAEYEPGKINVSADVSIVYLLKQAR